MSGHEDPTPGSTEHIVDPSDPPFVPTHEIQTPDDKFFVHAELSAFGGLVLYIKAEWACACQADWEQNEDGLLTFQGKIRHGAQLSRV